MSCATERANIGSFNGMASSTLSIAPDIMHVLDDLFTLCRVPFVTDFIFTQDAVADISMLTSPVQNEHAIVARIRTNLVGLSKDHHPGENQTRGNTNIQSPCANDSFSANTDLLFCTIPSFSVGSITVGFCTSRRIPSDATSLTTTYTKPNNLSNGGVNTCDSNSQHPKTASTATSSLSSLSSTTQQNSNSANFNPSNIKPVSNAAPSNRSNFRKEHSSQDVVSLIGSLPTQCNRFVRDDARGVLLVVTEDEETKTTCFDCMQHRSSSRRTRICARFDSVQLRQAILHNRGDTGTTKLTYALIPALQQLSVAYEKRTCPLCQSKTVDCACVLPFRRPAHPLDFRHERANMALYTGRYDGFTTIRVFNNQTNQLGVPQFESSAANSRSVIKGNTDRSIISALINSAVKQKLSLLSFHPLPFGQPTAINSPFVVASLVNGFHHQQQQERHAIGHPPFGVTQSYHPQGHHPMFPHQQLQQQQGQGEAAIFNGGVDTTKTTLLNVLHSPPMTPSVRQHQPRSASPDFPFDSAASPNQSMMLPRDDALDILFSGLDPGSQLHQLTTGVSQSHSPLTTPRADASCSSKPVNVSKPLLTMSSPVLNVSRPLSTASGPVADNYIGAFSGGQQGTMEGNRNVRITGGVSGLSSKSRSRPESVMDGLDDDLSNIDVDGEGDGTSPIMNDDDSKKLMQTETHTEMQIETQTETQAQMETQPQTHRRALTTEEKERRAEIRKERNRVAAARSNIKRKIRNESLRRDLAAIQKRAAVLRQREKELRAENVTLRSLALQRHLNVGVHLSHIRLTP